MELMAEDQFRVGLRRSSHMFLAYHNLFFSTCRRSASDLSQPGNRRPGQASQESRAHDPPVVGLGRVMPEGRFPGRCYSSRTRRVGRDITEEQSLSVPKVGWNGPDRSRKVEDVPSLLVKEDM